MHVFIHRLSGRMQTQQPAGNQSKSAAPGTPASQFRLVNASVNAAGQKSWSRTSLLDHVPLLVADVLVVRLILTSVQHGQDKVELC